MIFDLSLLFSGFSLSTIFVAQMQGVPILRYCSKSLSLNWSASSPQTLENEFLLLDQADTFQWKLENNKWNLDKRLELALFALCKKIWSYYTNLWRLQWHRKNLCLLIWWYCPIPFALQKFRKSLKHDECNCLWHQNHKTIKLRKFYCSITFEFAQKLQVC